MLRTLLVLVALMVVSGCGGGRTALQAEATQGPSASADDFQPKPSAQGCVLCAETNPLLVVDKDGHAKGTIRLRNRGTDPLTLQLFVSQFTTAGEGEPDDLDATTTLTVADPMTKAVVEGNTPLLPNAAFDITITAANLWQPGPSAARLMNGTDKVIDLKALRYAVPFDLRIDGPTPERADLSFTQNRETALTLRNDDPMTYRFRWNLEIDGHAMGGMETVPPNKEVRLKLRIPSQNFTWVSSGTLRSDTRAGVLTLELEPHQSLRNYPFPVKRYPIAARLNYWNEPWQGLWNSAWILLLLLLGISSSWLVNFILPLQKRRVAIKQRLYDIEGRLAGLDELIDPIDGRLLNLMRVEKKGLRLELRTLLPVFPQSGVDMPRLEERLDNFRRRITWVSTVGALLQNVQRHRATMSLREVELFRAHCGEILSIAGRATAATDVAEIDRQMAALAVPGPDAQIPATLLEDVLTTSQALRQKIRDLTTKPRWEPCSNLLAALESDFPPVPGTGAESGFNPARADFVQQEAAIRKAVLLVKYMDLVDQLPDDDIHKRRLDQRDELLKALKPGPDESLSNARDVVDQTVQNVYLDDVLHEISEKAVYIEVDPATPLPYQLTDIALRFRRPGVDDAAARRGVACEWTIDRDALPSRDWTVTHCFTDRWHLLKAMLAKVTRSPAHPYRSRIHVRLKERGKETGPLQLNHDLVLERTKSAVEAQTWLSAGSLLVTLLLIGFGLATGAEEKLRSLDLVPGAIAVFILGFGADALKTLITRNSQ